MRLLAAAILVAGFLGFCSPKTEAQVNFGTQSQQFTYTPVNGGTGGLVGVVIPNSNGLTVNVATGSAALPLQNVANAPGAQRLSLGDDSQQQVPIGFTFPYWGQNFTNSWMYSNGIVSFTSGNIPGAGCCSGQDLSALANQGTRNSVYNYMIAPLWTDLIDINNNATWVLKSSDAVTYGWYNTHEYYNNNTSSFEVNINKSGAFDVRYGSSFVSTGHTVTSGFTGDLSRGQYFQYYYGQGFNVPSTNRVSYGTTAVTGTAVDPCLIDPLSSTSCAGYQAAYTTQQCTINALFDPSCPGYQVAYQTQQCTINPLYNSACPGYYQAYHDQQCNINPLYATDCPGYATMYLAQQCSLNSLYSTTCPGYQQAYFTQQCSINSLYSPSCPGYATAYHDQQCSISPLFASDCPGYAQAYQTYQFNRACQANPQSSPTCPGYVTPVITTPTVTTTSSTTSSTTSTTSAATVAAVAAVTPTTTTTTTTTPTAVATTTTTSGGVITSQSTSAPPTVIAVSTAGTLPSPTAVAVVADPVVNNVIVPSTPSASSSATAPASASSSSSSSSSPSTSSSPAAASSSPTAAAASSVMAAPPPPSAPPPPTRASMIAARQPQPTKEQAATVASSAMKDSENAGSMEQQKAVQNVVIGAMGYVAGFDAYNVALKDVPFYRPYTVYGNQRTVDNRAASRGLFGATDLVHNEMVTQQYQLGK